MFKKIKIPSDNIFKTNISNTDPIAEIENYFTTKLLAVDGQIFRHSS